MNSKQSVILGLVLGTIAAVALSARAQVSSDSPSTTGQSLSRAQSKEPSTAFQEEFHKTYPLDPGGRIELKNINGAVKITSWNRNEVKVDALKYAGTRERLAEASIQVEADPSSIYIRTKYEDHNLTFTDDDPIRNPASVDYNITVPAGARLDSIKLVNGNLDIENVSGDVYAACVNGRLRASGLRGRTELSTVNGTLAVTFAPVATVSSSSKSAVPQFGNSAVQSGASSFPRDANLKSVNGHVEVTLPSDADAEVHAKTVSGFIHNDFGLPVNDGRYVGHSLAGRLGSGAAHIELKNVNGSISVQRASDGKPLSPATNLLSPKRAEMD